MTTDACILGGTPVFRLRHVPAPALFDSLKAGVSIDDSLQGFPTATREEAIAFLAERSES